MFYRYEFDSKCEYPHTGILTGLDDLFDDFNDVLFKAIAFFEDYLEAPKGLPDGDTVLIYYFTEKGNRKFNKAISWIKNEVSRLGVNVIRLELDESIVDKVYYRDKYQVVVEEKYISESSTTILGSN